VGSQSGFTLLEVMAVMAILSIMVGLGMHSWQEHKRRANLEKEMADVHALALEIDRLFCRRDFSSYLGIIPTTHYATDGRAVFPLAAAKTQTGRDITVNAPEEWLILLERDETMNPVVPTADAWFLARHPTFVVHRTTRNSIEALHLIEQYGARAGGTDGLPTDTHLLMPNGAAGGTHVLYIPVERGDGHVQGSQREFQFMMRDNPSGLDRC